MSTLSSSHDKEEGNRISVIGKCSNSKSEKLSVLNSSTHREPPGGGPLSWNGGERRKESLILKPCNPCSDGAIIVIHIHVHTNLQVDFSYCRCGFILELKDINVIIRISVYWATIQIWKYYPVEGQRSFPTLMWLYQCRICYFFRSVLSTH